MKKIILNLFAGKKSVQKYFEFVYLKALDGMNYGNSGEFINSGEITAAEYVKNKLQNTTEKITVFDVGANVGKYAVELANVFSKGKKTLPEEATSDFENFKGGFFNTVFYKIFKSERIFLTNRIHLPVGVSILSTWIK